MLVNSVFGEATAALLAHHAAVRKKPVAIRVRWGSPGRCGRLGASAGSTAATSAASTFTTTICSCTTATGTTAHLGPTTSIEALLISLNHLLDLVLLVRLIVLFFLFRSDVELNFIADALVGVDSRRIELAATL